MRGCRPRNDTRDLAWRDGSTAFGKQQIPFRNDGKKGKGNSKGKGYSRFPSGMTERKATTTARAKATADSLQE
jgi:hypothetical protein